MFRDNTIEMNDYFKDSGQEEKSVKIMQRWVNEHKMVNIITEHLNDKEMKKTYELIKGWQESSYAPSEKNKDYGDTANKPPQIFSKLLLRKVYLQE